MVCQTIPREHIALHCDYHRFEAFQAIRVMYDELEIISSSRFHSQEALMRWTLLQQYLQLMSHLLLLWTWQRPSVLFLLRSYSPLCTLDMNSSAYYPIPTSSTYRLYGVTLLQAFLYFQNYGSDGLIIKTAVRENSKWQMSGFSCFIFFKQVSTLVWVFTNNLSSWSKSNITPINVGSSRHFIQHLAHMLCTTTS